MVFLDASCMSACPSWINSWEGLVVLLSLEGCSEAVVMPFPRAGENVSVVGSICKEVEGGGVSTVFSWINSWAILVALLCSGGCFEAVVMPSSIVGKALSVDGTGGKVVEGGWVTAALSSLMQRTRKRVTKRISLIIPLKDAMMMSPVNQSKKNTERKRMVKVGKMSTRASSNY